MFELVGSGAYATAPAPPSDDVTDPAASGSPARATSGTATTAPATARPTSAGGQPAVDLPQVVYGPEPPPPPGPFDSMELDVRLRMDDNLVVRGKDLRPPAASTPVGLGDVNITLGGELRLRKAPGKPVDIVGDVVTIRGTYDFQGRRFQLERDGRIRFQGINPADPALDFAATRVISGVEARVHVGGTATSPSLTLSSRPPLDEADILSLIVFNQPVNQLGAGESVSLAQRASALATGFVASKLADSLGSALNLDIFEIEAAPEGAGETAAVTLGEQVGERLFLRLRQGVGAESTSQFIAEYKLFDFLRLETTVSQGGTATRSLMRRVEGTGVGLIFFFSY
jgi:translocation and assembly module TamB